LVEKLFTKGEQMRALILAVAIAASAGAQEKLGTISFPNSGNSAAQEPFLRGMKLYWSFEYARAAEAFKEAQKADPSMALAYVGEALTHTHQVWNEQNVPAAREALGRFGATATQRMAKAGTPRERGYVELAEYLYGDGPKARRDTLFVAAAERLVQANPGDDEAKMFYAIGLLGLNQSVREPVSYAKAGAVAEEVFKRNGDHPAAAHFIIHAYDDPVNAPRGLAAARAYSKIAPGAPHAQHMTTHIFVAMGMWDDVIAQNIVASGHDHDAYQAGHYTWWLVYGLGQAGKYAEAKKQLSQMHLNFGKSARRGEANALAMMRAHFLVDTERWGDEVGRWESQGSPGPNPQLNLDLARTLGMLQRGNLAGARQLVASRTETAATTPEGRVLQDELRAALASASGDHAQAIKFASSAASQEESMPYEFGPPQFVKPTHELLGEIYLAASKPKEAKAAFEQALARFPGRSRSLIGLIRASSAAGDRAAVRETAARLSANWHSADADVPELTELTRMPPAGAK
jgi:tetratricopeptide (TPR) repeat protein